MNKLAESNRFSQKLMDNISRGAQKEKSYTNLPIGNRYVGIEK